MDIKQISREDLVKLMLESEQLKLVDVLASDHYAQEHIKGAISLPVDDIEKKAGYILKDKNEKIVVYCASFQCQASTQAAEKLIKLGYTNVLDYKGGLRDYKEADLPLEGSFVKQSYTCKSCI